MAANPEAIAWYVQRVTEVIGRAERFFTVGLSLVGVALATLVVAEML